MISIDSCPVTIQTSAQSVPSTPGWMGEVALIAHYLRKQGVLSAIAEQVRFARRRFGRYEVLDFVAVLLGYAISGERTLEAFYERLSRLRRRAWWPCSDGSGCLRVRRSRAFWPRFPPPPVEALRTLFLSDGFSRPLDKEEHVAGLWDRQGTRLPRLRRGWHARGRPATGFAKKLGSAHAPAPFASPVCRLSTPAASVGKWCARAPQYSMRTRTSGWPVLATPATDATGQNCAAQWWQSRST